MPIYGLTDTAPSFKEYLRLRKGAPKDQGLKDLEHFRPDFRPGTHPDVIKRFYDLYGSKPFAINARLPFETISQFWDASYRVYNTRGLMGIADGKHWQYLTNQKGEVQIFNGNPVLPFDPTIPVYSYFSQKKQKDIPVFPKPTAHLKVVLPGVDPVNYAVFLTHSVYDILKISSQLKGIEIRGEQVGLKLYMIPVVISRRPEEVPITLDDGTKSKKVMNLINIEIDYTVGTLMQGALEFRQSNLLQAGESPIQYPSLPARINPDEPPKFSDEDEGEDEISTDNEPANPTPEQEETPDPAIPNPAAGSVPAAPVRPYQPDYLKFKINERVKKHNDERPNAKLTPKQRNLARHGLELCWIGLPDEEVKDRRHTVLFYLFGFESTNNLDYGQHKAIVEDWLDMKQDSGGEYHISQFAPAESMAIWGLRLAEEGQTTFLNEIE